MRLRRRDSEGRSGSAGSLRRARATDVATLAENLAGDVERARADLVVDAAQILADDTQENKLDPAEQQDHDQGCRLTLNRYVQDA